MKEPESLASSPTEHDVPLPAASAQAVPGGVSFMSLLLILTAASLIPLINLGRPKLGSPHEARIVVTGHNMAASGDYVVPRFNDSLRLQKPPLPYWTIAAMVKIVGHPIEEGLFRLPSALMGIICVGLTFFMACRLFDRQIAILAALIQALTVKFIIEERLTRVDIYLTFWTSVALLMLAIIFFGRQRRDWLWWVLGLALGMGFLSKWVNILMFVLPSLIFGLFAFKDRRPRWYWHVIWIVVFLGISLSWVGLLIHQLGWDTVRAAWDREIYDNITSPEHRANHGMFYYIPQILLLTFPWSALTPSVFMVPFIKRLNSERSRLWWVFLIVLVPFVILSFVSKKKVDYLLPAMPALAILGAKVWQILIQEIAPDAPEGTRKPNALAALIQPVILLICGLVLVLYALYEKDPVRRGAILVSGIAFAAGGGIAVGYVRKGRGWQAFLMMSLGATVAGFGLFGIFVPSITRISSATLCTKVAEIVGGDARLFYYKDRDDTLVYYLKRPIPPIGPEALQTFINEHPNQDTYLFVEAEFLEEARHIAKDVVLHHPRFRDVSIPLLSTKGDDATDLYLLSAHDYDGPRFEPEPHDTGWIAYDPNTGRQTTGDALTRLQDFVTKNPKGFVLIHGQKLFQVTPKDTNDLILDPRFRLLALPIVETPNDADSFYVLEQKDYQALAYNTVELLWVGFGFLAQAMFFARFFLQWLASEKKKASVIPNGFWWFSLLGGLMLLTYAAYRKDPVFIVGQSTGVFIYLRNLYFIYLKKPDGEVASETSHL